MFSFKPAIREKVNLIIGLIGSSGSGKTYTALRLATGISGNDPFALIDTEAGRSRHYAESFRFDVGDLEPPFRPERYLEAIVAADKAGYPVIVVDSLSHEHAGEGGLLDWHDEELTRMAGDDWRKREASNMTAWIRPKMGHKQFVQRLLQIRAHLILCFRAEQKIDVILDEKGKMRVVPKVSSIGIHGWIPICEKNLPYELTCSFLLTADQPGIPQPIKLQEQHRKLFPLDTPITEQSGERLAAWAKGGGNNQKPPGHPGDERSSLLGQIMDAMTALIPTDLSVTERKARGSALQQECFGTSSWTRIQDPKLTPMATLRDGLATLQERLAALHTTDPELATEGEENGELDEEMAGSEAQLSDTLL